MGSEVLSTDLLNWIANNGFAVAVAVYSLTRLEKQMKNNTDVLTQIKTALEVLQSGK